MKHYFVSIHMDSNACIDSSDSRYGTMDRYYQWAYGGDGYISCFGTDLEKLKRLVRTKLEQRMENAEKSVKELLINNKIESTPEAWGVRNTRKERKICGKAEFSESDFNKTTGRIK